MRRLTFPYHPQYFRYRISLVLIHLQSWFYILGVDFSPNGKIIFSRLAKYFLAK